MYYLLIVATYFDDIFTMNFIFPVIERLILDGPAPLRPRDFSSHERRTNKFSKRTQEIRAREALINAKAYEVACLNHNRRIYDLANKMKKIQSGFGESSTARQQLTQQPASFPSTSTYHHISLLNHLQQVFLERALAHHQISLIQPQTHHLSHHRIRQKHHPDDNIFHRHLASLLSQDTLLT